MTGTGAGGGASGGLGSGAIWFAIGAQYAREAERSAASVRAQMPGLGTAIVVDVPVDESLFDHVLKPAPGTPMKRQKMATLLASPFERTLFLDTDTLVIAPVWEVFDVLDRFDAAMAIAPGCAGAGAPSCASAGQEPGFQMPGSAAPAPAR
jgi:hypothetical protein